MTPDKGAPWYRRLACKLGFHDYYWQHLTGVAVHCCEWCDHTELEY